MAQGRGPTQAEPRSLQAEETKSGNQRPRQLEFTRQSRGGRASSGGSAEDFPSVLGWVLLSTWCKEATNS